MNTFLDKTTELASILGYFVQYSSGITRASITEFMALIVIDITGHSLSSFAARLSIWKRPRLLTRLSQTWPLIHLHSPTN